MNTLSYGGPPVNHLSSFVFTFTYLMKGTRFFHIMFTQTYTAHNICLTHIRPSILIYANALGYVLSIGVEFVMQNMMSICLCCCIWKGGGSNMYDFQKIERDKIHKTAYFNVVSF